MLSILLFIGSVLAILVSVLYLFKDHWNYIIDFISNIFSFHDYFTGLLPAWLLPYAAIGLVVFIVGIILKVI